MDLDLTPKLPQNLTETEGGAYFHWSSTEFPVLADARIGAGKLVLKPQGFVLPHYADCAKVGYVLQGNVVAGMVIPKTLGAKNEVIHISLREGDVIPLPIGSVSWWYNHGNSDFIIIFVGQTPKSIIPGEINYFYLTGGIGTLEAFPIPILTQIYHLNEQDAYKIAHNQKGLILVKLDQKESIPEPQHDIKIVDKWIKNINNSQPDVETDKGGRFVAFTEAQFPVLGEVEMSTGHLVLEGGAVRAPMFAPDASILVFYVARGSGHVHIVGLNSKLVLDSKLETGQLFVVPRFFVVTISAHEEGLECFSIITSSRPAIGELAGKDSLLRMMPAAVLQGSLNVTSDLAQLLNQTMEKGTTIIPSSNIRTT